MLLAVVSVKRVLLVFALGFCISACTSKFSVTGPFIGFEWEESLIEELPGFRYLQIGGTAPTTQPAIATGSSVSIPFWGEFQYCQLKSARSGYNDCSQVPAEQIVDWSPFQ